MQTHHVLHFDDARLMSAVDTESVDLVVTSPPYPMIQMWDTLFAGLDPKISAALSAGDGPTAFELMHALLDPVWSEIERVLKPGGIACINVGDAVRTLAGTFRLYSNHARILSRMLAIGFQALPSILWRKPTNSPTKFMGSGMLPPGAYMTLEHEHILILRKGAKRRLTSVEERGRRRASAYFWEERNLWFSDVWVDLIGVSQHHAHPGVRDRSAAFPFELPYRLINMFSILEDVVLDPFLGTGTAMVAAAAAGRNAIGYEMAGAFGDAILASFNTVKDIADHRLAGRLAGHLEFVRQKSTAGHVFKHQNIHYGFPVISRQETELRLQRPSAVVPVSKKIVRVDHEFLSRSDLDKLLQHLPQKPPRSMQLRRRPGQIRLFDD